MNPTRRGDRPARRSRPNRRRGRPCGRRNCRRNRLIPLRERRVGWDASVEEVREGSARESPDATRRRFSRIRSLADSLARGEVPTSAVVPSAAEAAAVIACDDAGSVGEMGCGQRRWNGWHREMGCGAGGAARSALESESLGPARKRTIGSVSFRVCRGGRRAGARAPSDRGEAPDDISDAP